MGTSVYVPADHDKHLRDVIEPGSGIVGRPPFNKDMRGVVLFYEGSLNGRDRTFARKVADACARCPLRYPTVGMVLVEPESVVEVGSFDGKAVEVTDPERLAKWLGIRSGSFTKRLARSLGIKTESSIPASQLVDYPVPAIKTEEIDPRDIQRRRYAANPCPLPSPLTEPDISIGLSLTAERFTAVARKLDPTRFPDMDNRLAAILRYIVEERFATAGQWKTDSGSRKIAELSLQNGELLKRDEGESDSRVFYKESGLVSDWKGLLDAAGLMSIERAIARESFYRRVVAKEDRFFIVKHINTPKETAPENKTKEAGLIWNGFAKPDDPVSEEGGSVNIQPRSGQRSSKPSISTEGEKSEKPEPVTTYPRPAGELVRHWDYLTEEERQEDREAATRRYSRRVTKPSGGTDAPNDHSKGQETLGPITEAMIANLLEQHPTLTREEALKDLRAAGAC